MKQLLGSSPITSVIGYLAAIDGAIIPFLTDSTQIKVATIILAVLGALYARASKDSNSMTKAEDIIVAKVATDGIIPPEKSADETPKQSF